MAQQNPWEVNWNAPAQQPAPQPPRNTPPAVIPGAVSPTKQAAEARAQQDQAIQAERLRLDQEKAAREAEKDQRTAQKDALGTVEQGKSASFLKRAVNANTNYSGLGDIGARSYIGQKVADIAPDVTNYFSDANRQKAEQAEREFIAAVLRYDSGAAIPPEEFVTNGKIYFPRPGDTPEVIAQKAQARRVAIEGLKASSGPAGSNVEIPDFEEIYKQAIGTAAGSNNGANGAPPAPEGGPNPGTHPDGYIQVDPVTGEETIVGWTQEAEDRYNRLIEMNNQYGKFTGNLGTDGKFDAANAYGQRFQSGVLAGFADETDGLGGAIASVLRGQNPIQGYRDARDASRIRQADMERTQGLLGKTVEFGGAMIPAMLMPGATSSTVGGSALAGGTFGAVTGMGEGRNIQEGTRNALINLVLGAGTGAVVQGGVNRFTAPRTLNSTMQAAQDLGIDMMPAAVGGTGTRMASGVTRRTLGELPIAEGAEKSIQSAANARDKIAAGLGRVTDETGAGQAAQRGGKAWISQTEKRGGELYEKISIPNNADASADNTRAALTELLRGFDSNPELSKIWTGNPRLKATLEALTPEDPAPRIQALRDAEAALTDAQRKLDGLTSQASVSGQRLPPMPDGGIPAARRALEAAQANLANAQKRAAEPLRQGRISWEDLKRLRSIVGDISGSPSLTTDGNAKNALKAFYGALSKDMEATAGAFGPKALQEFNRANTYWRGRENRIETVLKDILGDDFNKGEADAFRQINRWAQSQSGDFKRLAAALRSMPKDEADTVRATLLGRMGAAKKGQQNVDGTEFSPAVFMTQWNGLDARAKAMLFPNTEQRKNINKLALVLEGMRHSEDYANKSLTSLGTNATASVVLTASNPLAGIFWGALQLGAGKLLASPKFARIVGSVPAKPSQRATQHFAETLEKLVETELGPEAATAFRKRVMSGFRNTGAVLNPANDAIINRVVNAPSATAAAAKDDKQN